MRISAALVSVLVAGCVVGPATDDVDPSGTAGGKADGDGAPNEACSASYIEWMLLEFKPALAAKPIDSERAAELEVLAHEAPCRGELLNPIAFTTWFDVMAFAAFTPYFRQHSAATVGFLLNGSPDRGNYDTWLLRTQPTEATRLTVRVMEGARGSFVIDRLSMDEWINHYHVMAELVLHRLFDPSQLLSYVEGYWTLNAGEAAMLDLLGETRPKAGQDGAYAAWVDEYGEILRAGISIDSDDDYVAANSTLGCEAHEVAPCGRERFLDRFTALRPAPRGDVDSEQWMWELSLWASLASTSSGIYVANDSAQVARVDAVRPTKLSGDGAYRVWLEVVGDTATASNPEPYTRSVLPAKPCTRSEADAHFAAFVAEHPALPQTVRAAAMPAPCAN